MTTDQTLLVCWAVVHAVTVFAAVGLVWRLNRKLDALKAERSTAEARINTLEHKLLDLRSQTVMKLKAK